MKKIFVTILILLTSLSAVELDVAPKDAESNVTMMQESQKVFGNRLFNGSFPKTSSTVTTQTI